MSRSFTAAYCSGSLRVRPRSAVYAWSARGGKNMLTAYTFGTGVAQHTFCSHCGMHAFYIPRSQPDSITVNARCLDDIDGPSLRPTRFFDGRHWEEAQRKRITEGGHVAAAGLNGAVTLQRILELAPE